MHKHFTVPLVLVASSFALLSCGKNEEVAEVPSGFFKQYEAGTVSAGDLVKISYVSKKVKDDSLLENVGSGSSQPINVLVGGGTLFRKVEESILGMRPGETKTVVIEPKEAYGEKFVKSEFVRTAFGKDAELEEGQEYRLSPEMTVRIVEEDGDRVVVEQPNPHPLAGERISYSITLKEILPKNGT